MQTDRLAIKPLTKEHAQDVVALHALPEVGRFQGWNPSTPQAVCDFVDDMLGQPMLWPGQWFQFAILHKATGGFMGDLGVCTDPPACLVEPGGTAPPEQATCGISLHPKHQGHGLASEALRAIFAWLFEDIGLHRVHVSIDPRNAPSLALFKRLGFRQEAHFKQSLWFKGEWVDDIVLAMLHDEWLQANR